MTSLSALKHIVQSLLDLYDPGEAVSIAAIVLEDAFGIEPKEISKNQKLTKDQETQLKSIIGRLLAHEPVQYVMERTVFYGFEFKVTPAVLIPRQETEETVAWVIETVDSLQSAVSSRILDIGTGSGCIPVAVKKKRPELEVHALDVSAAALAVAKENAKMNHTEVHFHQMDIFDKKAWNTLPVFDLIVSNPPYVTESERRILPKNVIDFEPHLALFAGGNDSQRFVKIISEFGLRHLSPGGWLMLETNEYYATKTQQILEKKGYVEAELRKDLNKKLRMIRARKN